MIDKKYTDKDIISSLEVIATTCNCNECKIRSGKWGTCNCSETTANAALNLINRQKADIERLEKEKDSKLVMCIANDKDKIKSEAIKDFAERLKEEIRCEDDCGYHCFDCCYECKDYVPVVDNLVKEMTEADDNG